MTDTTQDLVNRWDEAQKLSAKMTEWLMVESIGKPSGVVVLALVQLLGPLTLLMMKGNREEAEHMLKVLTSTWFEVFGPRESELVKEFLRLIGQAEGLDEIAIPSSKYPAH